MNREEILKAIDLILKGHVFSTSLETEEKPPFLRVSNYYNLHDHPVYIDFKVLKSLLESRPQVHVYYDSDGNKYED